MARYPGREGLYSNAIFSPSCGHILVVALLVVNIAIIKKRPGLLTHFPIGIVRKQGDVKAVLPPKRPDVY
jgi:hypothetical protein